MSTLLKWAQSSTQSHKSSKSSGSTNGRSWIHPPDALQKGHIAYLVKFLGCTVVDQPKGIEVVKEGIRKLRFSQQLKKSETGAKTKKVELTISADGVAIQEPRTHAILHQFPLHRISYCADDKGEKKFFSFIAKQSTQENGEEEKHECFVFISDKLAEEITLTIGQAFELAYKRFLDTSGRDLETQRRAMLTQQRIKRLEQENNVYKKRLVELCQLPGIKAEIEQYLRRQELKNILELPAYITGASSNSESSNNEPSNKNEDHVNGNHNLVDLMSNNENHTNGMTAPPVPPRHFEQTASVGTKLEGLLLNEFDSDQDFDPRSFETSSTPAIFPTTNGSASSPPLIAPPPKAAKRNNFNNGNSGSTFGQDLFGATPFSPQATSPTTSLSPSSGKFSDPFEMGDFSPYATSQDIENAIGMLDKKILEMKTGFSRGISFGNDDFSLESLDPLKN